jgi:hypothetical protein
MIVEIVEIVEIAGIETIEKIGSPKPIWDEWLRKAP